MRKGQHPSWIISDGLWQRVEPLLPRTGMRATAGCEHSKFGSHG